MWSILALGALQSVLHHMIDLDAITRIQLNQLQGKMLRIIIDAPQLSVDVFFDDAVVRLEPSATGHSEHASIFEQRPFDQAQYIRQADATLHVPDVIALCKLLLSDEIGNIPLQGDYKLLQEIQAILLQAEPDLAAHLSPWLGPTLAHEIGKLQIAPKHLKNSLESGLFFLQDALKEDAGLFAPRWQMDDLQQDTRILKQNLDRAEAKIQQLSQQIDTLPDS